MLTALVVPSFVKPVWGSGYAKGTVDVLPGAGDVTAKDEVVDEPSIVVVNVKATEADD